MQHYAVEALIFSSKKADVAARATWYITLQPMRLQHNIKRNSPLHHYAVDAYGCQGKEVCVQVKQLSQTNP